MVIKNKEIYISNQPISLVGIIFTNGPEIWVLSQGTSFLKIFKMILDTSLLNIRQYNVHIKGKVLLSREMCSGVPTLRCSSYSKRSLLVALDYGHQLYFLLIKV